MGSESEYSIREQYCVKKKVSVVWKYFEKLNRFRVRCSICNHEQNYQGTTGNILRHLKNKHDIDATHKGKGHHRTSETTQSPTPSGNRSVDLNEDIFNVVVKTEQSDGNVGGASNSQRQLRGTRTKVSYCEESDIDPYAEDTTIEFTDYMANHSQKSTKRKSDFSSNDESQKPAAKLEKPNANIAEERILAEIDYFREKAAYYRMQKNLTALQAKKVRYELDQFNSS